MFDFDFRSMIIMSKDFESVFGDKYEDKDGEKIYISSRREDMVHFCQCLLGEEVIVTWKKRPKEGRNNFDTGISICGTLDYNEDKDIYRVLINEQTYTYFSSWDIVSATLDQSPEGNHIGTFIII